MKRLRKFLRLSSTEQRLLFRALILLGVITLGLRLLPFRPLRRILARGAHAPGGLPTTDPASADRIPWAVAVASRSVPGATSCLIQALAAQVLLEQAGFPAPLHIGVARDEGGQLKAHAWVEHQGAIVIGSPEAGRYTPLMTLGVERR